MKKTLILILLLAFVAGCSNCPECPEPGGWSACSEDAVKTRTNYDCSEETGYECSEIEEQGECATEIILESPEGIEGSISPTLETTISGIVTIEATSVPEGTGLVKFIVRPSDITMGGSMSASDLAQVDQYRDTSDSDGWSTIVDTSSYENGVFSVDIMAMLPGDEDGDPLDMATTQVQVEN